MLLSSVFLFVLPLVSAAVGKQPRCLQSGDEVPINDALSKGGKLATVTLCQGSTHRLKNPIVFTHPRQTLMTEGAPKGRERAMLIVEGAKQVTAILADCRECSGATVRSLIIDGNRPALLRVPGGGGLIAMGNAESQTIRDCRLFEPRGWTAVHFREGDLKHCRKAHVVDNEIGPCGEEWDDDYDGPMTAEPIAPNWGKPWADGISLACQDSLVERNIITDSTDGAIVVFGSPGSEIRENHIYSRSRANFGGINLVDYEPWKGDYFGTTVHHNYIYALAGFIRVGIAVGPATWTDDTETIIHSGSVTDNHLVGTRFGYGLVVSSADKFTVLRNTVDENAVFSGVPGYNCPSAPENGPPTAFLINRGSAKGTYQSEFTNGEAQHVICINPPDEDGKPYKPWRFRDSDEALARQRAEETGPVSFDSRLAEAVVTYQMKLLAAVGDVNKRLEKRNKPVDIDEEDEAKHAKMKGKTGIKQLDELYSKLDGLDHGERKLQREMEAVQRNMVELTQKFKKATDDNKPILTEVFNYVADMKAGPDASKTKAKARDRSSKKEPPRVASEDEGLGPVAMLLGSGAIVALALAVVKRYRSRLGGTKKGKVF